MPKLRITPTVAPLRVRHAKGAVASAVGTPVGYSQAEIDACLARMRDAQPDTLATAVRLTAPFRGEPSTIPPNNLIADVLDTDTSTMRPADVTRAVLLYADAILSRDAVPSAWPGPTLRSDGRSAPRTAFTVERWKQRAVQGLALGLASPALRGDYAEAIMSICRGWRTVYVTKPSGDAAAPRPITEAQAGASAVGVVTAGVDTLSNYLRGQTLEQRAEALSAENIARIEAATGRAVSGAEATALLQVARAQLAQSAVAVQVASPPPAAPQKSSAGVYVVGGLLVAGAVGAYFYTRRKRR